MSSEFRAPEYVRRFQCLGGDCEDTCCQHWDIHYDKAHYEVLAQRVNDDPQARVRFERHIVRVEKQEASDKNYARIAFQDDGYCPFLEQDGLCRIHGHFGVGALCNTCAYYPRVISQWGEQVEIAGALSCPEMARLCFDAPEPFRESKVPNTILPRPDDFPLTRGIDPHNVDDYMRNFMRVRATMLQLMQDPEYPIETRLYAMSSLTHRLSAFYFRGASVEPARVDNECQRILSSEILEMLDDFCARYEVDEPVSMVVVQSVFQLRLQMAPREKLAAVIRDIIESYRYDLSAEGASAGFEFDPQQLWRAYQARAEIVNEVFGVALEDYLSRYVLNCLYREWYVSMPDAFSYTQMLIIRLSLLRFLLMSSPRVAALARSVEDKNVPLDEAVRQQLQAEVVYIVYNFARAIDHNMPFLQMLYQAMNEQQMITFDYALPFIKG